MNENFDPNARYNSGSHAAGTGRTTFPPRTTVTIAAAGTAFTTTGGGAATTAGTLTGTTYAYGTVASTGSFSYNIVPGLTKDGSVIGSEIDSGQHCAGAPRSNPGPNVAGAPRSFNNT